MRANKVLRKLRVGQPTYGFWLTSGSPIVAEAAAQIGFDWLLLDTQHGYWGASETINAFQVIGVTETVPLARAPWNDPAWIGRLLDAGALGLVVPMVNSRADAQRAVAAMRYPPEGARSAGGSRLGLYGADYLQQANEEILVAVMIETRQAVDRIEEIISVPGVDCGFIGPGDLALSLGTFGRQSEAHEEAIGKVLAAGKRRGVPVGMACRSVEECVRRAEEGFQFLGCGSDIGVFTLGARQLFEALGASSRRMENAK